jgi:hypothetical protein
VLQLCLQRAPSADARDRILSCKSKDRVDPHELTQAIWEWRHGTRRPVLTLVTQMSINHFSPQLIRVTSAHTSLFRVNLGEVRNGVAA